MCDLEPFSKIQSHISSPIDQSTVQNGNDVAFIEVLNCSPPIYIANNYSNTLYVH